LNLPWQYMASERQTASMALTPFSSRRKPPHKSEAAGPIDFAT